MRDGVRHTFNLAARDQDAAIVEAMELRKNPRLFELGEWNREVDGYIAQALLKGRFSEVNAENRRTALVAMGRQLGVASARSVTPAMVNGWLMGELERLGRTVSVQNYFQHLRTFLRWLVVQGKLASDPTLGVEAPTVDKVLREMFVPFPEVAKLLADARALGDRDLEWILGLGFECGFRRGEISACHSSWFDLRLGSVTVPVTSREFSRKGEEGRRRSATIPLSAVMLEIIGHHGLPAGYVVAPQKEVMGKNRYRFEFKKRLKGFMTARGLGNVTIHDMRRSFASNRVSAGVSIEKVANWMGIDVKTAWKHYARFIPADEEINRGSARGVESEKGEVRSGETKTVRQRLEAVQELLDAGLIRPEEAEAKRAVILGDL